MHSCMATMYYFSPVSESPQQPLRNFPGETGGSPGKCRNYIPSSVPPSPSESLPWGTASGEFWKWSGATRGISHALEPGATQSSHCSLSNLSVKWFLVSRPDSEVKASFALRLQSRCSHSLQRPSSTDAIQTEDCLAVMLQNPAYPIQ